MNYSRAQVLVTFKQVAFSRPNCNICNCTVWGTTNHCQFSFFVIEQCALELIILADLYLLVELKTSLEYGLSTNHLDISTLFHFLFIAEAFNCSLLLEKCKSFVESNTYDILSSEVTLILPYACFKSFIVRDYLIVREMRAVLRWINQNDSNMEEKTDLLGCVR